jgi:hypothetical protein
MSRTPTSTQVRPKLLVRRGLLAIGLSLLLVVTEAGLRRAWAYQQELTISANFASKESVSPSERIELTLNRALESTEGTLAVFINQTDMTSLFTSTEKGLTYSPNALLLPVGDNSLTVYLISPGNDWKRIAQFPLRVKEAETVGEPTPQPAPPVASRPANGKPRTFGFDTAQFKPSLTINIRGQSALLFFPESNRPERSNFTDISFQGSLQSSLARGSFNSQSQFDFVGTSYQRDALRFGQRGAAAPQIDLSSYLVQFQINRVKVLVGHTSYGTNRYLINGFSSRGVTVTFPLLARADFSFSLMNGTSVVGWSNFFGLDRRKHQIVSGTLGYEFLKRPGGLRVEAALLYGSLLPVNDFNRSNLTDAERSRGFGLRVVASDHAQRFRLDAGYGRSRFGNPADPFLNQGFNVVPVRETARGAYYLDLSYQILKDLALSKERKVNLSFAYRHNRVDPLFRSVAVFTQADRLNHQLELTGNVGEVTLGLSYNRLDDNLDDIPSILKTLNRRNAFQLATPLDSLFAGRATPVAKWLPRISYSFDRTHAFGAFLPTGGDFSLSHVPDQSSTNQSFGAEWQRERWRFGYRFNQSFQDNRQVGRELADFKAQVHNFSFGVTPFRRLNLSCELSSERANTLETNRLDRSLRAGFNFTLQTTKASELSATVSSIFAGDVAKVSQSRNADLDLQWGWRFGVERGQLRKVQGQFFIRYANRYARATDNLFLFRNITKIQTTSAGLSFTFF